MCPQIAQGGSLAFSNLNAIADTEQDYGYVFCTYSCVFLLAFYGPLLEILADRHGRQGDGTATNGLACVYNVDGSWDETANVVQADYCQGTTTSDPAPDQSDWMTWTGWALRNAVPMSTGTTVATALIRWSVRAVCTA